MWMMQTPKPIEAVDGTDPIMNTIDEAATNPSALAQPNAGDPFSRENLRVQAAVQPLTSEPELFEIEVRKPKSVEWVRTWHEAETFYELLDPFSGLSGISYLVAPGLVKEIPSLVSAVRLYPTITRQRLVFLWKVVERDRQGRQSSSAASQHEAALRAMKEWVQITWPGTGAKAYQIHTTPTPLSPPEWPKRQTDLMSYIRLGYRDRVVTSLDDPNVKSIINKLLGNE
jgi:hypothetical protein